MKIFLTGGTGFVGRFLSGKLLQSGHEVTVLTRSIKKRRGLPAGVALLEGDPNNSGPWQDELRRHDAIINLAGASIFTLWTAKARKSILESRIRVTRNVVNALAENAGKKITLISCSAVGYYGCRDDDRELEESSPPGDDFLAQVSRQWEAEALRAEEFGARVAVTRFGIVLGRAGGALSKMIPTFKRCLGSPLGNGRQWFSWIHEEDIFRIMAFLIEHPEIHGPINTTAPHPVRNREFTHTLLKVFQCPVLLPSVPGFLLKALLGDFGNLLLKGQRVTPKRLLEEGFQFRFPTLREALENLVG